MKPATILITFFLFFININAQKISTINNFKGSKTFAIKKLKAIKNTIATKHFDKGNNELDNLINFYLNNNINDDSLWVAILNTKSINLKHLGKFKKAILINDKLLKNQKFILNFSNVIYHTRSRLEIDLGKYDNAIKSAKKALNIYQNKKDSINIAALQNIIGVCYYFNNKLDSALYYYNESYNLKRRLNANYNQLAIATTNIGIVYEDMVEYDKAIEFYKKSAQYDLEDRGEEYGFITDIYIALANTYFNKNDIEKCEEYAEKALKIALNKYGPNNPVTSFVYATYSNVFESKGEFHKSINYLKRCLEIRKKTYGINHRWTSETYINIADNQFAIKDYQSAIINYKKALQISKTINNSTNKIFAQIGLANIYTEINNTALALKYLNKVKPIIKKIYGETHESYLYALQIEATIYYKNKNYTKVVEITNFIENKTQKNNHFFNLFAINQKLKIASKNLDTIKNFNKYLSDLDKISNLVYKIRNNYPTSKSKIYVNNKLNLFIQDAFEISFVLFNKTNNFKFLIKAFQLSELNKNSTMIANLNDIKIKEIVGVSSKIINQEQILQEKLNKVKKDIFYQNSEENLNNLLSKQITIRNTLDSLILKIETNYPRYYKLKYQNYDIDIQNIQKKLITKNQTLLEYYMTNKAVYIFVITKNKISLEKREIADSVRKNLLKLKKNLIERKSIVQETTKLYNFLLNGLDINTKSVIIIPDKELYYLPFEILTHNNEFLIKNKSIHYLESVNLLSTQKKKKRKKELNFIGFSPEFSASKTLINTDIEINEIAKLMKGKAFIGKNATLDNFNKYADKTAILHIATHTVINQNNPLYSKLLFTDNNNNNSQLTVGDIYTLNINSDLVVLSACDTGFGKLNKGEGVMSLARAFHYANVPSTVMSLWKVPDKESYKIMTSFYKYLKKGMAKNKALQFAKIDYLKTTDDIYLKHPYYWAGFIISGDVSPVITNNNNNLNYFIFLVILLIVILVIQYVRKKQN